MNREELAWAAGFVDGEGSFNLGRDGGNHAISRPQFNMTQVNRDVLERFTAAIGFGKIYGPYVHEGRLGKKPQYCVRVTKFEHFQALVALLWNWLSEPKRRQIKDVLTTYNSQRGWGKGSI